MIALLLAAAVNTWGADPLELDRIRARRAQRSTTVEPMPASWATVTTAPPTRMLISSAPRFLERPGSKCQTDTILARTWPRLEIGLQRRCGDWIHPKFAPSVVMVGPETEPGKPCTLTVALYGPGDTFVHRWRNNALGDSCSCWSGAGIDTIPSWRPIEAW